VQLAPTTIFGKKVKLKGGFGPLSLGGKMLTLTIMSLIGALVAAFFVGYFLSLWHSKRFIEHELNLFNMKADDETND